MNIRIGSVIRTVAVKELKDFFRDPRSLLLSLGLPLILFPLLFWVLNENQEETAGQERIYRIAVEAGVDVPPAVRDSAKVVLSFSEKAYPFPWLSSCDALLIKDSSPDHPVILYDNSDPVSIAAYSYLEPLFTGQVLSPVIKETEQSPVNREPGAGRPLLAPDAAAGRMFLGLILPFIFFIFSITCPLPGAADLSSGEKERGSLEPLLSTAAPRSGIILGKLTAAALTGMCSVCAYFMGLLLSSLLSPGILGPQAMSFALSFSQAVLLLLLLIMMICLFTAIEICAGFITRSVREAQLLSMPLLMIGMGAVYVAQNLDLKDKSAVYSHIPLVNLALAVKEAALDRIIPWDMVIVFCWNLGYLALIALFAINMFQKEFSLVKKSG